MSLFVFKVNRLPVIWLVMRSNMLVNSCQLESQPPNIPPSSQILSKVPASRLKWYGYCPSSVVRTPSPPPISLYGIGCRLWISLKLFIKFIGFKLPFWGEIIHVKVICVNNNNNNNSLDFVTSSLFIGLISLPAPTGRRLSEKMRSLSRDRL